MPPQAIEPELLARLKSDVEQIKHVAATGGDGIVDSAAKTRATFGLTTDFQSNLLQKSAASWELAIHPNLLPIIEGVLGHHCLASSFGFRHVGPGEQAQALHTDDGLYDFSVFERPFKKQLVCNSMLALDDFTVANGATRLVPTSHRWAEYPGKPPLDPGWSGRRTLLTELSLIGKGKYQAQASNEKPDRFTMRLYRA